MTYDEGHPNNIMSQSLPVGNGVILKCGMHGAWLTTSDQGGAGGWSYRWDDGGFDEGKLQSSIRHCTYYSGIF